MILPYPLKSLRLANTSLHKEYVITPSSAATFLFNSNLFIQPYLYLLKRSLSTAFASASFISLSILLADRIVFIVIIRLIIPTINETIPIVLPIKEDFNISIKFYLPLFASYISKNSSSSDVSTVYVCLVCDINILLFFESSSDKRNSSGSDVSIVFVSYNVGPYN